MCPHKQSKVLMEHAGNSRQPIAVGDRNELNLTEEIILWNGAPRVGGLFRKNHELHFLSMQSPNHPWTSMASMIVPLGRVTAATGVVLVDQWQW